MRILLGIIVLAAMQSRVLAQEFSVGMTYKAVQDTVTKYPVSCRSGLAVFGPKAVGRTYLPAPKGRPTSLTGPLVQAETAGGGNLVCDSIYRSGLLGRVYINVNKQGLVTRVLWQDNQQLPEPLYENYAAMFEQFEHDLTRLYGAPTVVTQDDEDTSVRRWRAGDRFVTLAANPRLRFLKLVDYLPED